METAYSSTLTNDEVAVIEKVKIIPNPEWRSLPASLDLSKLLFKDVPRDKKTIPSVIRDLHLGKYGNIDKSRVDWVLHLKKVTQCKISRGDAITTLNTFLKCCKQFHSWLQDTYKSFAVHQQHSNYIAYSHHLAVRVKNREISDTFRYDALNRIACFIDTCVDASGLSDKASNVHLDLGLKPAKGSGRKYDQQVLSETKIFAQALLDIYCSLSDEAIYGQLPVRIVIAKDEDDQKILQYNPSPAYPFKELKKAGIFNRKRIESLADRRLHSPSRDLSHDKRWALINIKRNAFLMMFIIASGANFKQLLSLTNSDIKTVPAGADQTIYKFKNRAKHDVKITIYNAFKSIMRDYKSWRDKVFVDELESPWLFPSLNADCSISEVPSTNLSTLRNLILESNIVWQPPRIIRRTSVNWMYRHLNDASLASDIAGHDLETFYSSYHVPNHQRAISEAQSFWANFDPSNLSVVGGHCNGEPIPVTNLDPALAKPNCTLPSACLFCESHRDIDSSDYVWSLVSFRFLKLLEAGNSSLAKDSNSYEPVDLIINRVTEKLEAFKAKRLKWVEEAISRVEDNDYHPNWVHLIDMSNGLGI